MRAYVASERREAAEEIAEYFEELSVEDIQEIEKGLLQTVS